MPAALARVRDLWRFVEAEIIEKASWNLRKDDLPPVKVLVALQTSARLGIQRVREGKWFSLKDGIRHGIARRGDSIVRGSRRGTFEDLFNAAVMDAVQAFWTRLHECPRCHQIFLKIGKQEYCTTLCASRTHWEAFKARRQPRDHRREYARRIRKQVGPNVKIAPRRRS